MNHVRRTQASTHTRLRNTGVTKKGSSQRLERPESCYEPPDIPVHSSIADRRCLSGPALRRFFWVMKAWRIDTKDTRLLMGGITSRRYRHLSIRPEGRILNEDQLLRVNSVIAIDKALHKLFSRRRADKWARTPNWRFIGGTPLFNLIAGGAIGLWEWRLRLEKKVFEGEGRRK